MISGWREELILRNYIHCAIFFTPMCFIKNFWAKEMAPLVKGLATDVLTTWVGAQKPTWRTRVVTPASCHLIHRLGVGNMGERRGKESARENK